MRLRQLLVALIMLLSTGAMLAQQMSKIPVDPNVRIGHLSNGLTYYIRHNNLPEHVASYYIAQKVGSINEDENQRGLAHLLEHLAFNGSDHFKGNTLQEYLQGIGVEYGKNLNAYTAIDKTVYYFTNVPTTNIATVDSCMLILKDWSNGISLTQDAIDGERDVVHNEYRMRMDGQQRMFERNLPALYPGSKYGVRMPIGLMSVVDGCKPEALRSYYRKWYRPDNQAIIVVGDINVDHIEAQIKKLFGGIKVPAGAAKVMPEQVPNNNEPIYIIDKDKEQKFDIASVYMKHDATPDSLKERVNYLFDATLSSMICSMLDARYSDMAQNADCPFLQAQSSDGDYLMSRTKEAFSLTVAAKPGKMKEAYAAMLREAKRARDFGFVPTELQRVKDNLMSNVEATYSNRDKMKNEQFTGQYVDHFIANEPIPSVEDEYKLYTKMVPAITVDMVNKYAKQLICESDTNLVVYVTMRESDGATYPTAQELKDITREVRGEQLEAYVDKVKQEPLIAQLPKAGKIKQKKENKVLGFKTLTLSNGVKVVLKKTDYKENEILFSATAAGGSSAFDEKDYKEVKLLGTLMNLSGLGNFKGNDLSKALAGKLASCQFSLSRYMHGLSGNCTPKDVETMMQLIYLSLTNVTKDTKSFDMFKAAQITALDNQSNDPQAVYRDSLNSTLYMGSKFYRSMTSQEMAQVNYDRALELGKQLYGNCKDYTFFFVGNYDEATLLPLIERYLASLPSNGIQMKNKQVDTVKGEVTNEFTKAMANPQDIATEMWKSKTANSLRASILVNVASRMLSMDYNRNIREKLSAAYYAGASDMSSLNLDGSINVGISASAMLNPDKAKEAIPYFEKGLQNAITNPNLEDLQKVKEILLKQADVTVKTNGYWMGTIVGYTLYGIDGHTNYKKEVSAVDGKAVSDFIKNVILKDGNHFKVVMDAVQEKAK